VKNPLKHLFGLGLKAAALDAETDPEALAEMAGAMKDAEAPPIEETEPIPDAAPKHLHDALDRAYKGRDRRAKDDEDMEGACDADMEALKSCMDEFFKEEEEEEGEDEGEGESGPSEVTEPGGEEDDEVPAGDKFARAADRADAAAGILNMLRPFVARSKDSAVKSAFNAASARINKVSRASTTSGGYGMVARTARARDAAPVQPLEPGAANNPRIQKLQKAYDDARTGGK
jgi:hypothetical protein